MDAFDADVLIYAAIPDHPLGRRVFALFPPGAVDRTEPQVGVGSTLLLPEVLSKPQRLGAGRESRALWWMLEKLDLRPLDNGVATLAVEFGASYKLLAPDAVHLATAVVARADRFITNNRRHFPKTITEVDVTYPDEL